MNDEQMLEEIKKGVTQEVFEKLMKELPARKDIFGSDTTQAEKKALIENKQKSADYIKALYSQDFAKVKALSAGGTTDGGYLAPDYFASEVLRIAGMYGAFRRNARIVPMAGKKTLSFPTVSSVIAYRVGEKSAITSSQPTTGQVKLTLKKLAALIPVSNELLEDANIDVVDMLTTLSAEALAKLEDQWGFLGLGANEGVFQTTGVPVVTLGSGDTTFAKVDLDDLIDMMNAVDEGALTGAKWYMSFSVFNLIRKIKDENKNYIYQAPAAGMPATIWNFPVEFVSVMPKSSASPQTGTKFLAFGNLQHALLGDGKSITVDISKEATVTDTDGTTPLNLFEQDMSAVRVIERLGIELSNPTTAYAIGKTAAS